MNTKGLDTRSMIISIVILLALAALILFSYLIITGKMTSAIAYVKNLFSFGGSYG